MEIHKTADMSEDGGYSAGSVQIVYFVDFSDDLKFELWLECSYPPAEYDKLVDEVDIPDFGDDWKAREKWEMAAVSKAKINEASYTIYRPDNFEEWEEDYVGHSEEHKYSWPAFHFENIKPDKQFWEALFINRRGIIPALFRKE